MNQNNNQQKLKSPLPPIKRDSPAYLHDLIVQAAITGVPFMILTSEPEPLTLCLIAGIWATLETRGEPIETEKDLPDNEHPIGTGHDCLIITAAAGTETLLTVNQTAELLDKLEIMLGKKRPAIIIPELIMKEVKKS